jgi:hypothetical protein
MKNYKLVDKTPYHAAGFGAMAGASTGAATVGGAIVGGLVGAGVGLMAGGVMAYKDAKRQRTAHFQDAAAVARHEK